MSEYIEDDDPKLSKSEIENNLSGSFDHFQGKEFNGIKDVSHDINGEELIYRKDPCLHRPEIKLPLTKEHVTEIAKCMKDPIYFIERYCYINDANLGRTIIKLYPWQKKLINMLQDNKYNILLLPRQSGKSLTLALFITWYSCFYRDKLSAIMANKGPTAREIFSRVMLAYRGLPHFLKGGVYHFTKSVIQLDNGSSIMAAATSESGLRGYTINGLLILDECIFGQSKITIRSKKTGIIEKISIRELYNRIK